MELDYSCVINQQIGAFIGIFLLGCSFLESMKEELSMFSATDCMMEVHPSPRHETRVKRDQTSQLATRRLASEIHLSCSYPGGHSGSLPVVPAFCFIIFNHCAGCADQWRAILGEFAGVPLQEKSVLTMNSETADFETRACMLALSCAARLFALTERPCPQFERKVLGVACRRRGEICRRRDFWN